MVGSEPGQTADPASPGSEPGLRESLLALSHLATAQMDLSQMLIRVADLVVRAIPAADGAGLTLLERGHSNTIVASAAFVADVDAIQYGIGEGPCITAASQGHTVRSGTLDSDRQWPRFGPRVAQLGVHSVLSLPLLTPAGVVGAMNVYAHPPNAFDEHSAKLGELFAVPAAIAVQNAQVLDQARRLASELKAALTGRAAIDQALGILMSRSGSTADEATAQLEAMSRADAVPVGEAAQRVIDNAVRRARERRSDKR